MSRGATPFLLCVNDGLDLVGDGVEGETGESVLVVPPNLMKKNFEVLPVWCTIRTVTYNVHCTGSWHKDKFANMVVNFQTMQTQ